MHNENMIRGYARVSTDRHSLDALVRQLRAAECEEVFLENFERQFIRLPTREDHERAKARGGWLGRPLNMTSHPVKEGLRRRDNGEPMRVIGQLYGVSHSTISRLFP